MADNVAAFGVDPPVLTQAVKTSQRFPRTAFKEVLALDMVIRGPRTTKDVLPWMVTG